MKGQCIKCKGVWGEGVPDVEGYTHGLCEYCANLALVNLYKGIQRKEGNFECCGTAACGFCDQGGCRFRVVCLKHHKLRPASETSPGPEKITHVDSASHLVGYKKLEQRSTFAMAASENFAD